MRLSQRGRLFAIALALVFVGPAAAAEALSDRIDALIAAGHRDYAAAAAPIASDAEFLRRVTLDLVGRIPTADRSPARSSPTASPTSAPR